MGAMTEAISRLLLMLVFVPAAPSPQAAELPRYVGQQVCVRCHAKEQAPPCRIRPIPEHRRSFRALSQPEAGEIAALCGVVGDPKRSVICLGCHAAAAEAGPRWTLDSFSLSDGVQCESCHGPGSLHDRAHRSGVLPIAGARRGSMRSLHQPSCRTCHRPRASHRAVLDEGYRRSLVNAFYKTPINLAVSPDGTRLYVVAEHSNSLIVVEPATGRVLREIRVGLRPHGVAVGPNGDRLFVTNRLSDSVTVIDARDGRVWSEIPVASEPHGLAADAQGRMIFVANTGDDSISVIDSRAGREVKRLVGGRGPWGIALAPSGRSIYATNVRPQPARFREPHCSEISIMDSEAATVRNRPIVRDANMVKGIAFIPAGPHRGVALFTLMRTKALVPATRLAQGWMITHGLGLLRPDGQVDQVLLDLPNSSFPDPNDVAVSPDGRYALVSSGGADRVAVLDVDRLMATVTQASDEAWADILPNHLGTSERFVIARIDVGRNPRGVVFSPDGRHAYVANALDDTVMVVETIGFTVTKTIDLGGPSTVTELRRGERLFHSADITRGQQFSCQSCHPDGHTNGLTLDLEPDGLGLKPVENRTLRGILDTNPFKWEGTNPTLSRQCGPRFAVFLTRLAPYSPTELRALVRYIRTIERPPNRRRSPDGLTPAQYRGKLVFERAIDNDGKPIPVRRRCITCHSGPYKTAQTQTAVGTTMWFDARVEFPADEGRVFDAKGYGNLGLFFFADTGIPSGRLDVPHLNNVRDDAPYLHNGSAWSLEEIWTRFNQVEGHGDTRDLTRAQFNDLMAYLRAL